MILKLLFKVILIGSIIFSHNILLASCDCGSIDHANPCTGKNIFVTVDATSINGKMSHDANFKWDFNSNGQEAYCGQFANGDYWVAPRNGKAIQFTSITGNGPISVDLNPQMESTGILSEANDYGNYNKSENIMDFLPVSATGPASVVAAIQRDETISGKCGTAAIEGRCIDAYHVLTVLPDIPKNAGRDMIRPNITGKKKELLFLDDFDLSRLPRKDFLSGATEEMYETIRQRWTHNTEIFGFYSINNKTYYSEGGRAFRAHILVDDYGSGMAAQWYADMMCMFSSDSIRKKRKALAAMLAYGLDLYHGMYDSPPEILRAWGAGAGQHQGRFIPAVFMAALAKNPEFSGVLKTASSKIYSIKDTGPAELSQVQKGKRIPVWGDIMMGDAEIKAYWADLFESQCYDGAKGKCNPQNGSKTGRDPYGYIDGPAPLPGTSYMRISAGTQRALVASMLIMPEIGEIVNFRPLIDYVFRLDESGITSNNDPCAAPDSRESLNCRPWNNGVDCRFYGITWGPDNKLPTDCIKNDIGRFSSQHGKPLQYAYTIPEVEKNWRIIRQLHNHKTLEKTSKSLPAYH